MSLNTGVRLVRLQSTLHHRTSSIAPHFSQYSNRAYVNFYRASQNASYSRTAPSSKIRPASTSTASQPSPSHTTTASTTIAKSAPQEAFIDTLNPPATTRPPQLDLPVRDASTGLFSHLLKLGKAYTAFYKAGLKAVFTNRRLLKDYLKTQPPTPEFSTRAVLHLRDRVNHDFMRLPLFGIIAIICGELTPIVVLLFPRLTPYTCRIPSQAAVIRRAAESRRRASFRALSFQVDKAPATDGHICRSLGLGSKLWDTAGFDVPFAAARADKAVQRIVRDDVLIRGGGGVSVLVDDEVVIACEERGIDTLHKEARSLRELLGAWLERTRPSQMEDADAAVREAIEKTRVSLLEQADVM
ncbi:hypothetical protein GGS21DRAFT_523311 [Xylaria nigripes]|nr:hypothetical protein GGS21DRAFT_523311 [Xylaria nigripes]